MRLEARCRPAKVEEALAAVEHPASRGSPSSPSVEDGAHAQQGTQVLTPGCSRKVRKFNELRGLFHHGEDLAAVELSPVPEVLGPLGELADVGSLLDLPARSAE